MTSKMKTKQFKWLAALLLLVAAMVMPSTAWAEGYDENGFGSESDPYQPATLTTDKYDIDGDGTKDNVYEIGNAGQLYWFADLVNGDPSEENGNYTACAVLTDDIIVNGTWTPIIDYEGTFDGKGHTISGLKIEFVIEFVNVGCPLGLFGVTNNKSVIRNVGIVNCEFSVTQEPVGCVCGSNNGTIENCYTTGSIKLGSESISGCVCGINKGTIKNCYNTGTVDGIQGGVGGVCGLNEGTIENCYYLSGTAAGGITGADDTPGSVEVKDATQFASGEVAWLLNGKRSEGTTGNPLAWYQNINGNSYPVLDSSHKTVYCGYKDCLNITYSNNQDELSENPVHNYNNGICEACKAYQPATLTTGKYDFDGNNNTKDEVYEIGNAGQLYWFAGLVNGDKSVCNYDENTNPTGTKQNKAACAVLTSNIVVNRGLEEGKTMLGSLEYDDASGNVTNGSNFVAWTPIGFNYQNYTGTFDGKGHTVSGLYFNDTNKEMVGLFGYVDSGGKISNVGVLDSYFEFSMRGGGICGHNKGEINNCTNGGTVIANGTGSGAGGVCGMNYGTVKDCENTGSVSGTVSGIGGVCGAFYSGSIENCLNEGTVSGTGETSKSAYGGVCGHAYGGVIKLSSNTASVSGNNAVGGVCGYNQGATLEDCYNTGDVVGTANSSFGGVCGSNSSGYTIKNCYNTGAVSGIKNVGGVCGENRGIITNCYYISGTATGGINGEDATGSAEGKTLTQFTSGEVAYLLNEGKAFGTQVWGQQINVNDFPLLGSAYKVLMAARDGLEGSIYWATFSNLNSNAELIDPKGDITVYNATVSSGTLTLTKRSNKVSSGEGVLLKANSEYVNAKSISDYVDDTTGENDLVATPKEAGVLNDTNYKHYRLTYNDVDSKEGLGFYLGVVKDETGKVTSNDGSQIRVTPGKAYLNVLTSETKLPSSTTYARSFAFPRDNGGTTGIGDIVIKGDAGINGSADGDGSIFDLQGRKVSKPAKGVYIKNNKLFLK